MSARPAAAQFGVGIATAIVWVRRARESGERTACPHGRPRRSKLDPHRDFLLDLIAATEDITLSSCRSTSPRSRSSVGTIWTFLDHCNMTVKRKSAHAAEQDRPDVLKRRQDWFEDQLELDPARLVFIDETTRREGRGRSALR
jgi:transposase